VSEHEFFDTSRMACAWCSYVILCGYRVALCTRCTPLVKTEGYLGPLPALPRAENRRECWICQRVDPTQRDPSRAVFCEGHIRNAEQRRRRDPWNHAPLLVAEETQGRVGICEGIGSYNRTLF
jgi:hypothetical protein